jgi:hypothetical protein
MGFVLNDCAAWRSFLPAGLARTATPGTGVL